MSLRKLLESFRDDHRAAFIPYITAGDPNFASTKLFVHDLASLGADVIELGVPFSDPVADGPVNQRASERALVSGASLSGVLRLVDEMRGEGLTTPIVLFTYLNPILRMGYATFTDRARQVGVSGVLVVDLPPEEADDYCANLKRSAVETIFLATPTSPPERLSMIDSVSSGFIYYVSRTGVTGAQQAMSTSLPSEVEAVRRHIKAPLAVGFGISSPEHARYVANLADGVVVGSALVRLIEDHPDVTQARASLRRLSEEMVAAVRGTVR